MAQVYFSKDNDGEMQAATEKARDTFRYFWRELSWEYRRIVPGFDMFAIKVPFQDPPEIAEREGADGVEHMWISEIGFDGVDISGTLLNDPNWLKSVSSGDKVEVPLRGISDWMYVLHGRAHGGFTINLLRSRMSKRERAEHDGAWGLDFGNPEDIQLVPDFEAARPKGLFSRLFGKKSKPVDPEAEHPMAVNMVESLVTFLKEDPTNATTPDDDGLTMLHQLAMAGTTVGVKALLEHGADAGAKTNKGKTAFDLAKTLGWKEVAQVLKRAMS